MERRMGSIQDDLIEITTAPRQLVGKDYRFSCVDLLFYFFFIAVMHVRCVLERGTLDLLRL